MKDDIILHYVQKLIPLLNHVGYYLKIKDNQVYIYNNNLCVIVLNEDNIREFTNLFYFNTKAIIECFNTAHYVIPVSFNNDYKKAHLPEEYLELIKTIKEKDVNIIRMKKCKQHDLIRMLNIVKETERLIYYSL